MPDHLNISIIQTQLEWENKEANLQHFARRIAEVRADTHIVVLPEMFSTGFSMNAQALAEPMDGTTVNWMKEMSVQHRRIITGSIIISEDGAYYNRLVWMQPNGQCFHYDKAHLFGKAGEDQYYTKGRKRLIVQVNGWKILLQTCYDLRFPVWARQDNNSYDVLINVANWPDIRSFAWNALLTARAIENQTYVVACNVVGKDGNGIYYSGRSSVIDYSGKTLWTAVGEPAIGYASLDKKMLQEFRKDFPFLQDRDPFLILPDSSSREA
ncbi:MAG: amidohydrolase [Taibaiella sp.]|nr:amidohydrolase [Taibaiella sp.]